jgi:hypothetical protein
MIIKIRGVIYASAKEAAAALGVSKTTVYSAIDRGCADTIGIGRGNGKRGHKGGKPKPVTICGHVFATQVEAADFLGYKRSGMSRRISAGGSGARENMERRYMARKAEEEQNARQD